MPQHTSRWLMATGNAHKVEEVQAALNALQLPVTLFSAKKGSLEALEENGATFPDNARLKASFLLEQARERGLDWVLGDDSGLVVPALSGLYGLAEFPGLHSNRWLTPERRANLLGVSENGDNARESTASEKCEALLRLLNGKEEAQRDARFVCALCLLPVASEQPAISVDGIFPVRIGKAQRGSNGFGYDPVAHPLREEGSDTKTGFIPALAQTVAELAAEEKTRLSHRGRALRLLAQAYEQQALTISR